IEEEEFRRQLERFYAGLDRPRLMEQIDFAGLAQQLNRPGGYKAAIARLRDDAAAPGWVWRRRFALLRHLGVRLDVLVLLGREQIPPHGHYRVVSGFYVLDGEVAVRHYDRVREEGGQVLIRPALDTVLRPGDYTTNSEYEQNIHWLCGIR